MVVFEGGLVGFLDVPGDLGYVLRHVGVQVFLGIVVLDAGRGLVGGLTTGFGGLGGAHLL